MVNELSDGIPGPPVRVLVVDDHGLSRRYTVAALRQAGLAVKAAATPESALRKSLAWLPDAVIVDIGLPGCNGYEWMARLVEAWPPARSRPRLVVLSGGVLEPPRSAPTPDAVLRKPASPELLYAVLRLGDDAVRDSAVPVAQPPASPALERLFRRELARSLEELGGLLLDADRDRARVLVHRLVASSRMCGEPGLESRLQRLQAVCSLAPDIPPDAGAVARAYCGVLAAARPLLDPAARASG